MPPDARCLRIVRTRRAYNRWAADQTFEDYALRFTARTARAATPGRAALTALGSMSFLALEAIGGTLTLAFGFANTALAIALVAVVIFCISLPLCVAAARAGLDIDLLTRGTGFGYIGSTITSLIYASFTFIFFGLEAAIMAGTLHALLGMPLWLAYLACSALVIPLVTWGISFIARFQIATQPVWLALNLVPLAVLLTRHSDLLPQWTRFPGLSPSVPHISAVAIGSAASIMIVLVCQSAEQIDFLRFLPPLTETNRRRWWISLVMGGPGWIVMDAFKFLAGSFLAWMALDMGFSPAQATQPGVMYWLAWGTITSPAMATMLTVSLVVLAQTKINITNAYAGSLAWSNFFSRLTHNHPGRVFYVIFNIAIALLLMEAGLVSTIQAGITLYAVLACSWIGAILGDVALCKPLGLSPRLVDFKRALLPDLNIVGLGAWGLGAAVGLLALSGRIGLYAAAYAPFLTLVVACATAPLLARATGGRTYFARRQPADWNSRPTMTCVICEHSFEAEDMASCPAYGGDICSLCCSLDGRCRDRCKPASTRIGTQLATPLRVLPPRLRRIVTSPGGRFAVLLAGIVLALGLLAKQTGLRPDSTPLIVLFLACVVGAWFLIMAQEGHRTAIRETLHQTRLLMSEVRARRRTDLALQVAREKAEGASLAKTRYISGISHEIRSPLNAIMGYIQLFQHDRRLPPERLAALGLMRESGEHITSILAGLLDISRIEAGRIELHSDTVALPAFLESVAQMIRPQAQAKGLEFIWQPGYLPAVVTCDEHRLRQILLNLLSNAVKFTQRGSVTFSARWRSQIAELVIEDTGLGVAPEDHARIFEPFERGSATGNVPGTGLGLTITKLLTEILGGELTFTSTPGEGSRFRVRLMLPDRQVQLSPGLPAMPVGYQGPSRTILVVDDNLAHRQIMRECLTGCGFRVETLENGPACLEHLDRIRPDLLLLDLSMPGMDGRELALRVRESTWSHLPILFLTGNLIESINRHVPSLEDCPVIGKPVNLSLLIAAVGRALNLAWVLPDAVPSHTDASGATPRTLPENERAALLSALESGEFRRLKDQLAVLRAARPDLEAVISPLAALAATYQLEALRRHLEHDHP
ncbi:response regulator [Gluconacetobacter sacchari]|uniref:histidine kinase n=1 Tax=Gluconacetobacter sacchari TaxID=92759 RepID=A0A7W4ICT6_9PROT|nr:response regulator [Gluconacetobacter sacchari]